VEGPKAPFHAVAFTPPIDKVDAQFPVVLTTGRRLDSYNTGVATAEYTSPLRRGETLDISPEDAQRYGVAEGEVVRVSSRRGSLLVPVHLDRTLRAGLAFMTFHFADVHTNVLTLDTADPKSGTSEFKATAIRIDKASGSVAAAGY
jgi:anaerobic selenocysteine-containing dehydrogenase